MKKNRIIGLGLSAVMVLSLAACGEKTQAETLTGTAKGYGGDVTVTLTREDGKITACSIEGKDETEAIGGAALETLAEQVKTATGYAIDGVSGATVTSKAVMKAVAAALGEEYQDEETQKPVESAGPAAIVPFEGGIQLGLAYGAAHGTKCFTEAYAVVKDDTIIAAYVDEFQFVDSAAGLNVVPNSDVADGFAAGYAEGKALASKKVVNDYYSKNMAEKGGATISLMDNFAAIETYVVGKTIAEVETLAGGDKQAAIDAVSGCTLADTAGYLGVIAQAAKNAQTTQAVEFTGDSSALTLNVAYGAAHGTKCFTAAAAVTEGDKIVLSYIDEFQFVASDAGLETVPNSDVADGFAAGYAEGKALASKRAVADYYSQNMSEKGGATVRIDDNFNAIQNHVNGMTVADAKALAEGDKQAAIDAVSGATLADTNGYIGVIVAAAEG